ncbi:MAG: MarR family winged helix-turn-helix transcriptional regulator [Actinomycetota bacterium]
MTTTAPPDTAALAARLRLGVTRLARKLRQEAEPGITPSMLAALSSVERQGPLTMRDLCAVEQVQPPSMTRIVAALADASLVAREPDPDDGRVVRVKVSPEGRRLLDRSRRRKEAYLARAIRGLEARELDTLEDATAILERLTEGPP